MREQHTLATRSDHGCNAYANDHFQNDGICSMARNLVAFHIPASSAEFSASIVEQFTFIDVIFASPYDAAMEP